MTSFMQSVEKLLKENKKRRRQAFIKAKKDNKKMIISLLRPKKTNLYKKRLTDLKNK